MNKNLNLILIFVIGLFTLSCACPNDIDYSEDIIGTWVCDNSDWHEVLEFKEDGTIISCGLENDEFWQNVKGTWSLEGNELNLVSEDNDNFSGTIELIAGATLALNEASTGERFIFHMAEPRHFHKFVGTWTVDMPGYNEVIHFSEDGKLISSGKDDEGYSWKNVAGYMVIYNDTLHLIFEDGDDGVGKYVIIPGERLIYYDFESKLTYDYRYSK